MSRSGATSGGVWGKAESLSVSNFDHKRRNGSDNDDDDDDDDDFLPGPQTRLVSSERQRRKFVGQQNSVTRSTGNRTSSIKNLDDLLTMDVGEGSSILEFGAAAASLRAAAAAALKGDDVEEDEDAFGNSVGSMDNHDSAGSFSSTATPIVKNDFASMDTVVTSHTTATMRTTSHESEMTPKQANGSKRRHHQWQRSWAQQYQRLHQQSASSATEDGESPPPLLRSLRTEFALMPELMNAPEVYNEDEDEDGADSPPKRVSPSKNSARQQTAETETENQSPKHADAATAAAAEAQKRAKRHEIRKKLWEELLTREDHPILRKAKQEEMEERIRNNQRSKSSSSMSCGSSRSSPTSGPSTEADVGYDSGRGGTVFQTTINITKMCMGTGSLALPYAASRGGLLFHPVGTALLALWNQYAVTTLMMCARRARRIEEVQQQRPRRKSPSLSITTIWYVLLYHPQKKDGTNSVVSANEEKTPLLEHHEEHPVAETETSPTESEEFSNRLSQHQEEPLAQRKSSNVLTKNQLGHDGEKEGEEGGLHMREREGNRRQRTASDMRRNFQRMSSDRVVIKEVDGPGDDDRAVDADDFFANTSSMVASQTGPLGNAKSCSEGRRHQQQTPPPGTTTFGRVAWYAFGGSWGLFLLDCVLIVLYVGVMIALTDAALDFVEGTPLASGKRWLDGLMTALLMTSLSSVPDVHYLAPSSALGILALGVVFGAAVAFGVTQYGGAGFVLDNFLLQNLLWPSSISDACAWFGTLAFGYGVAAITFPIQESMAQPHRMGEANSWGMVVTCVSYCILGDGLALLYRPLMDDKATFLEANVLQFFPDAFWATLVRLAMAFVMVVSAPLVVAPCGELLQGKFFGTAHPGKLVERISVRMALCFGGAAVSVIVPDFVHVVSFVGALCVASVSFIFPPLLHIALYIRQVVQDQQENEEDDNDGNGNGAPPAPSTQQRPRSPQRRMLFFAKPRRARPPPPVQNLITDTQRRLARERAEEEARKERLTIVWLDIPMLVLGVVATTVTCLFTWQDMMAKQT